MKQENFMVSVKGGGLKADDARSTTSASAGFYESATGKKFPRVQLLTIEGLLEKKQRAEHPDHQPDLNFKKAKAEASGEQKELL